MIFLLFTLDPINVCLEVVLYINLSLKISVFFLERKYFLNLGTKPKFWEKGTSRGTKPKFWEKGTSKLDHPQYATITYFIEPKTMKRKVDFNGI